MKKRVLGYIILCAISSSAFAQQLSPTIVTTQGGFDQNENYSLAWSLGENNIETVAGNNKIYTQGFHQPVLELLSEEIQQSDNSFFDVVLSPNPTHSILNVRINATIDSPYYLTLINPQGKVFKQLQLSQNDSIIGIDVGDLPSGIYLLQLTDSDQSVLGIYKILKI